MKTEIKTKELIKVLEPFTAGILYKNQNFKLDMDQLKNYVHNPKKYNVFGESDNLEESLYKNLALYIINDNEKPKFVEIDLEQSNVIQSGLFEFVKNVFNEQETTYLSLPETGDNLLLVQSKKLQDLTNERAYQELSVEKAIDVELGGRTSVFMHSEKITEKNKFFWTAENSDRYSQTDFLVNKISQIALSIDFNKSSSDNKIHEDKEVYNVLKAADQELIKSDEFKLALLNEKNHQLSKVLINNHQPNVFSIDFSSDAVKNFLKEQIENKEFYLLTQIFEHNIQAEIKNAYTWVIDAVKAKEMDFVTVHNIPYNEFINHPNTIEHLLSKRTREADELGFNNIDEKFSIVSAYPYLNDKNKIEPDIVMKFLQSIIKKDRSYGANIVEKQLYRMPFSLYNEKYFLETVCAGLNFDQIKSGMKAAKIEPILLSDKNFIIQNCADVPGYNLLKWISAFVPKQNIDKQFLLGIVEQKNSFCETIMGNAYFKDYKDDIDILLTAVDNGYSISRLSSSFMKKILLEDQAEKYERIKIQYLIENKHIASPSFFFRESKNIAQFAEKYHKPEYLYLTKEGYSTGGNFRKKIQSKLKTVEEVLDIIDKTDNFRDYKFDASSFYEELPKHLQSSKKIVDRIIARSSNPFPYKDLSENLQFNSSLALKFIKMDPNNTPDIPKEFFNDIEFSLEFAKMMDTGMFRNRQSLVPDFIQKFFDNQEIKKNYYDGLNNYVSVFSLKEALDEKPIEQKTKRMKI